MYICEFSLLYPTCCELKPLLDLVLRLFSRNSKVLSTGKEWLEYAGNSTELNIPSEEVNLSSTHQIMSSIRLTSNMEA